MSFKKTPSAMSMTGHAKAQQFNGGVEVDLVNDNFVSTGKRKQTPSSRILAPDAGDFDYSTMLSPEARERFARICGGTV